MLAPQVRGAWTSYVVSCEQTIRLGSPRLAPPCPGTNAFARRRISYHRQIVAMATTASANRALCWRELLMLLRLTRRPVRYQLPRR